MAKIAKTGKRSIAGERIQRTARGPFRHRSNFSGPAVWTLCGLGSRGDDFALAHALGKLDGPAQA